MLIKSQNRINSQAEVWTRICTVLEHSHIHISRSKSIWHDIIPRISEIILISPVSQSKQTLHGTYSLEMRGN